MPLDVGTRARVRPKVIEGDIIAKRFCPETGALLGVVLSWIDEDGEEHHRPFAAEELESAEPDPEID